jgi:hypothetical protein
MSGIAERSTRLTSLALAAGRSGSLVGSRSCSRVATTESMRPFSHSLQDCAAAGRGASRRARAASAHLAVCKRVSRLMI